VSRFFFHWRIEDFEFGDPQTPKQMHVKLRVSKPLIELERLYQKAEGANWFLQATFDHGFMDKGTHEWVLRSWTGFFVSLDSCFALLLAICVGPVFCAYLSWWWSTGTVLVSCLLLWNATNCRQRCIDMIELQVWRRDSDKDVDPDLEGFHLN
jgi:hypothetical protein